MKTNWQKKLDVLLAELVSAGKKPRLLLHSCCGPCSSYTLEYLTRYFDVTLYYYNPNIHPAEEYARRLENQRLLLQRAGYSGSVPLVEGEYDPESFFACTEGYENEKEGGARCEKCFRLRLEAAAKAAKAGEFDYFATTISVSRHKNADLLNTIGLELEELHGVKHLCLDLKKRGGSDRSSALAKQYGLYLQEYCDCVYSLQKREQGANK